MPTLFLSGPAAAAGIATINSIGNLGGFVGPAMIGWIKDRTGSFLGGLYFVGRTAACFRRVLTLLLARSSATSRLAGRRPKHSQQPQPNRSIPMREYSIAAIPADGIGPEVITAGLEVLDAVAAARRRLRAAMSTTTTGARTSTASTARSCRPDGLAWLRTADAIYFGAVGDPDIPDHVTLWGLRLPICQGFDQYANVRPTRILPGVTSPLRDVGPGDLDWVIVREN